MANTSLPTNITPGVTATFEADVETAWAAINELTRDTGVRDVTSLLINGWTATYVNIQRVRDRAFLTVKGLNGTNATSTRFMDFEGGVGTGFSPFDVVESPAMRVAGDQYTARFTNSLTGGMTCPTGLNFGTNSAREFSWRCEASWPSTLPGTAV